MKRFSKVKMCQNFGSLTLTLTLTTKLVEMLEVFTRNCVEVKYLFILLITIER